MARIPAVGRGQRTGNRVLQKVKLKYPTRNAYLFVTLLFVEFFKGFIIFCTTPLAGNCFEPSTSLCVCTQVTREIAEEEDRPFLV